jgi:hypothetical protein
MTEANLVRLEELSEGAFGAMVERAQALIDSGFLPKHLTKPEQVVTVAMMGRELGLQMMQALRKIYVVNGTATLGAELMLALVNKTGQLEDMKVEDDGQACTVVMKRKGRRPHTERFSLADAQRMGLLGKDNWKKQPATMRKWRAISACCRVVFPDAIGGMHTPEEVEPSLVVDAKGELVEGAVPLPAVAPPKRKSEAQPQQEDPSGKGQGMFAEESPEEQSAGPKKISPAQLTRLYAIVDDNGIPHPKMREMLKDDYGLESSKDIPVDVYEEICKRCENKLSRV